MVPMHGMLPWQCTKPFARIRSWAATCCVMLLQSGIFCPTFNILTLPLSLPETAGKIQRDIRFWLTLSYQILSVSWVGRMWVSKSIMDIKMLCCCVLWMPWLLYHCLFWRFLKHLARTAYISHHENHVFWLWKFWGLFAVRISIAEALGHKLSLDGIPGKLRSLCFQFGYVSPCWHKNIFLDYNLKILYTQSPVYSLRVWCI